jgi:hypothetical protein
LKILSPVPTYIKFYEIIEYCPYDVWWNNILGWTNYGYDRLDHQELIFGCYFGPLPFMVEVAY